MSTPREPHYSCCACVNFTSMPAANSCCARLIPQIIRTMRVEPAALPCEGYQRREYAASRDTPRTKGEEHE